MKKQRREIYDERSDERRQKNDEKNQEKIIFPFIILYSYSSGELRENNPRFHFIFIIFYIYFIFSFNILPLSLIFVILSSLSCNRQNIN